MSKFCFIIICEERKQKVLILNSSEEFTIFVANPRHVRFIDTVGISYCFHFSRNLSDEKLPEMKRTFLFFSNLKPLATCKFFLAANCRMKRFHWKLKLFALSTLSFIVSIENFGPFFS